MDDNIFQMVIDKDEKTGKLIMEGNEFDIIKEDDSDSWQIIREYEEQVFKRNKDEIVKEIMDGINKKNC